VLLAGPRPPLAVVVMVVVLLLHPYSSHQTASNTLMRTLHGVVHGTASYFLDLKKKSRASETDNRNEGRSI
jgi:hypothetical protein